MTRSEIFTQITRNGIYTVYHGSVVREVLWSVATDSGLLRLTRSEIFTQITRNGVYTVYQVCFVREVFAKLSTESGRKKQSVKKEGLCVHRKQRCSFIMSESTKYITVALKKSLCTY